MAEPQREFKLLGRKRHYYGHSCVAQGCSNSVGKDKHAGVTRSYYTFPLKDPKRLKAWATANPRKKWKPTPTSRICSDHFKGGKKTNQPGSDGYIPTLYVGADIQRGKCPPKARPSRTSAKAAQFVPPPPTPKKQHKVTAPAATLGRPNNPKPAQDNTSYAEAVWHSDHDYNRTRLESGPPTELQALELENEKLRLKIAALERRTLSIDMLEDSEFPLWTNLPCRGVFDAILEYIEARGAANLKMWRGANTIQHVHFEEKGIINKPGPQRALSVAEELFLVLVKLKTGFSTLEMEKIFGLSDTTISQLFTTYVTFLSVELKHLFQMPPVNDPQTVAACFKPFNHLKVIIDCTEVFIEKAQNLQARKELYSNYKGHETVKFLVGMSPNLYVNYVSEAWGGRASDKHITLASKDLLNNLPRGSSVMTDRGFGINQELSARGVHLYIPEFKGRGRPQLSEEELAASEHIAEARIHIERIIQRIRTFHIVNARMKLSMKDIIEQIFTCCAYLTNFQTTIINE